MTLYQHIQQRLITFITVILLFCVGFSSPFAGRLQAQSPAAACVLNPELLGGQGFSVGGLGFSVGGLGFSVGGLGFSVGGLGFSVGGLGFSVGGLELDAAQIASDIANNPADLNYLIEYLAPIHAADDFNDYKVALIVVDDLDHGEKVEDVLNQVNTFISENIAGDVSNVVVEFVDVSDGAGGYNINAIAAELRTTIQRLETEENVKRFVINLSFGLLPCEDSDSGWNFNDALNYVEAVNNAPVPPIAVDNILEQVCENPDGSFTAHFGYENFTGIPTTIPFGPDNALTDSPFMGDANRGATPQYFGFPGIVPERPGRSPFFPNSAFQVTWDWDGGGVMEAYQEAVEFEYTASEDDADADGIPNDEDSCPARGNEGGVGIDETGCPYYDADWDGVYDRNDECPYRADEYGYGITADGCPATADMAGGGGTSSVVWSLFEMTETASTGAAVPCDVVMNPYDIFDYYPYEEYCEECEYEEEDCIECEYEEEDCEECDYEGEGTPPIEPILECVAKDDDGNYVAHLGFRNNMWMNEGYMGEGVMVTDVALNALSGGGLSAEEIAVLMPHYFGPNFVDGEGGRKFFTPDDPGRSLYFPDSAFQIPFNPAEGALVWEIYGTSVVADANSSLCAFPGSYSIVDYVKDVLGIPEDEVDDFFIDLMMDSQNDLNDLRTYLQELNQRSANEAEFRAVTVASSGNYAPWFVEVLGTAPPLAPARWPETIAASATLGSNVAPELWDFSHDGNVAVPGGGFPFMQDFDIMGTSFSAPQISRIMADWLTLDDACVFDGAIPPIFDAAGTYSNYRVSGAATGTQPIPNPFNCEIGEPEPPTPETPVCGELAATIYVADGIIVGGSKDGQAYNGTLNGTSGNDVIVGTDAKDRINGRDGNDFICGLDGNDVLRGGEGRDTIYGGDGNDNINGQNGNDTLYGDNGRDTINGSNGRDSMYGGDGNDRMNGQNEDDTMYGGEGNDRMNGNNGRDTMFGDAGRDTMSGGNDGDEMHGGEGNDTIRANGGSNTVYGDDGNDKLFGGSSVDIIDGGEGNDTINGSGAGDTLNGGAGNDTINGGGSNDTIDGGDDNDTCNGGGDSDTAVNCEVEQSIP